MVALILAPILQFQYPVGEKLVYDMTVEIDGHLPLLGWRSGKAKLELSFEVEGVPDFSTAHSKVKHRILTFRSGLNGTALPFKLENVKSFFPETTISYLHSGKVIESNAPKKELPSNIPGLDSQRFPEMTYLPIEWPEKESIAWTFIREMGGDPMKFKVNTDLKSDRSWKFSADQLAKFYEDGQGRRLADSKGAAIEVKTEVAGEGSVQMHSTKSIVSILKLEAKTKRIESSLGDFVVVQNRGWTTKVDVALRTK